MPLSPEDSPGFLLWHVTLRWQRAMVAALAPLDLTHVQFVLLATTWWLNERGEDPNQLTLARQAGTDVKMTSEVLRRLEAKGLIVRAVDATDTIVVDAPAEAQEDFSQLTFTPRFASSVRASMAVCTSEPVARIAASSPSART